MGTGLQEDEGPSPERDGELVRQALAGQRGAVSGLAARLVCVPRFLAAFDRQRHGLLGVSEIEDLSQDTILRLWEKLGGFPSYSTLEMWAFRFCQYEYLNRLRSCERRSRHQVAVPEPPERAVHDPEPDSIDWGVRLDQALDQLSEKEARLIRMKHFEERTFEDLARVFDVRLSTVKARYYRGLVKLRELLEQCPPEERLS